MTIERATIYMKEQGFRMTGNETKAEVKTLDLMFNEAVRWISSWRDGLEPYWLFLCGVSGTGKTMFAKACADRVIKHGNFVYRDKYRPKGSEDYLDSYAYKQSGGVFMKWRDLVPHSAENQERYANAKSDWVKVIDDLMPETGQDVERDGVVATQPKRFEITAAGDLLDERLRKWTIITTNLTRKQFALFWDVRIASRLMREGNTTVDLSEVRDFDIRKLASTNK